MGDHRRERGEIVISIARSKASASRAEPTINVTQNSGEQSLEEEGREEEDEEEEEGIGLVLARFDGGVWVGSCNSMTDL